MPPCNRTVPPGTVPFVMWMSERTGSSWVTQLLSSHPHVSMEDEIFNYGPYRDGRNQMCDHFTSPKLPRARGFKQKFLFCNYEVHRRMCLPPDGRHDALERCMLPLAELGIRMGSKNSTARASYRVYTQLHVKTICMLRRNIFEWSLSKASQIILTRRCGSPNLKTPTVAACWQRVTQAGVSIDPESFRTEMTFRAQFMRFQRQVCEAQAKRTPVFFLWYEDLLDDFEKTMYEVQIFLGVPPIKLAASIQKTNAGAASWIRNYSVLAHLAQDAVGLDVRADQSKVCSGAQKAAGPLASADAPHLQDEDDLVFEVQEDAEVVGSTLIL